MATAQKMDTPACRLLNLSAELRNQIYTYALCEEMSIPVTSIDWTQPALLFTCRRIRAEAAPIYYLENHFTIDTPNFNPPILLAFTRQVRCFGGLKSFEGEIRSVLRWRWNCSEEQRYPKWTAYLFWLKNYHDGLLEPMEIAKEDEEDFYPYSVPVIAVKGFRMVDVMKELDLSWEKIEKIMEVWRDSTAGFMEWVSMQTGECC